MKSKISKLVGMIAALTVAVTPALASYVAQITWDSYAAGTSGNFDLDLQVNNGLSGANASLNATYGTASTTGFDANGFFLVNSHFGLVLTNNSPQYVRDPGAGIGTLNATTTIPAASSPWGLEGRWAHETSTVAYDSKNTVKKWIGIWSSFPKSHPFTSSSSDPWRIVPSGTNCDTNTSEVFGKNFPNYGWLGYRTWSNSSNSWPDPTMSTLSAKEMRLFRGTAYNNTLESATSSWATGTPVDPVPSNTKYSIYSEPGAYYDSVSDTIYIAMTGNYCTSNQVYGDIVLVKSTNGGSTWSYVGRALQASDATYIDSTWAYFTASSLHKDPTDGSMRLVVSGVQSQANGGFYNGIVEFKFSSISTAALTNTSGHPNVIAFEPKETGVFTGAGTFNLSTGKHVEGRVCTTSCTPGPFTEYELNW